MTANVAVVETMRFKYQRIQEVSQRYFETKNERDFNDYYKILLPVVKKVSKMILRDPQQTDDNVSRVFMKMYSNPNFKFDPTKSHYSYIYNLTINTAKQHHNRSRQSVVHKSNDDHLFERENNISAEYLESLSPKQRRNRYTKNKLISNASDLGNMDDEGMDILEYLHHANNGENDSPSEIGSSMFHENTDHQLAVVERIISNLDPQQRAIFSDSIGKVNYNTIKEKYELNSEGAVKTRVHRIRRVVRSQFNIDMDSSFLLDGFITDGSKRLYFDDDSTGQVKFIFSIEDGKLHGKATEYHRNGNVKKECMYIDGLLNGTCKEFAQNGMPTMVSNYEKGIFHGKRLRYHNGQLDEMVDYLWGEKGYYELYEDGKIVDQGIFADEE